MAKYIIEDTYHGAFYKKYPSDWSFVLGRKYADVFNSIEEAKKALEQIDWYREYAVITKV